MPLERLQKVMAHAGVGSRRRCESFIQAGAVRVNGRVVTSLGTKVDVGQDLVEVHGRRISLERLIHLILYKPVGYVSTAYDPQGRPKVVDLVHDLPQRLYPVGRLDYNTEGLLILTNDGQLAHRLTHPRYQIPKTYLAEVHGQPDSAVLAHLAAGVRLEDGLTAPANVRLYRSGPRSQIELTIYEGRNRQVRRMLDAVGYPVRYLKRIRFDGITLQGLSSGEFRCLTHSELSHLQKLVGLPSRSSQTRQRIKIKSKIPVKKGE